MADIVIVEDEELERRALRTILERELPDVRVVGEAKNGAEAVQLIESVHIDLMLLDIRIPRPNGLELLEMLRTKQLPTKVLIITAYDHFEIMQAAIQQRADGFLLKPVRTETLLKSVQDCLQMVPTETIRPAPVPSPRLGPAPYPAQPDAVSPIASVQDPATMRERIGALVQAHAYRDCLTLVRRQIEALHAHRETAPRQGVLDLSEILTDLVACTGRPLPDALARKIDALTAQKLDQRNHYKVQELFSEITDLLFADDEDHGSSAEARIETVRNYIERNLNKSVTLEDAAEHVHISPCYLSRLFHKHMDMTFIAYLKERRVERAKELLAGSSLPIVNVALDLAYQDANYFCKAFKKAVGVSPTEYRRQCLPSTPPA
ncbi:AraC family two component transcriptional regulator [Rhodobacter aestuarii]|uniref:Two component transcriptional regulator, AraC family n=1 Tax=Rhodobacter aestuarii TaxID=453582 RepID=A0A1N7PZI8_9RHOB|nr:response regulator [Rhodobacter aestuarii]PTV93975.1 AraC family two component transcriptional regulator [Rhodobacter aestuarii]SIT16038.1 two component transcriptional regulator, AraC family [Rhodobacter aestuarii]